MRHVLQAVEVATYLSCWVKTEGVGQAPLTTRLDGKIKVLANRKYTLMELSGWLSLWAKRVRWRDKDSFLNAGENSFRSCEHYLLYKCNCHPFVQFAANCLFKEDSGMTDQETPNVGEPPPTYIIFLLVFFFFITGLLGFLICHLLKTKGYRCELEEDQVNCEDKLGTDKDGKSFQPLFYKNIHMFYTKYGHTLD